jgi:transposase-like protein
MLDMTNPIYSNETAARSHLEEIRWADGVYCPHCGGYDDIRKLGGASVEKGLWHCKPCRKKFTVTVGTVFERSHIPLSKWLAAFTLMCSSKKGISAHQGHRMLDVTYKTAWFMWHRIREAMRTGGLSSVPPMGGKGKVVEADETYFGNLPDHLAPPRKPGRPPHRAAPQARDRLSGGAWRRSPLVRCRQGDRWRDCQDRARQHLQGKPPAH